MLRLRPVSYRQLARLFEKEGWQYDEVPVFVVKNLLRTAGMSQERYFELLREV
jgi:hypothetical protein